MCLNEVFLLQSPFIYFSISATGVLQVPPIGSFMFELLTISVGMHYTLLITFPKSSAVLLSITSQKINLLNYLLDYFHVTLTRAQKMCL